ncbi:hypothetical protein [Desulfosporosinus shakirovi]|uniref:hypothetical protein n=1 Tax=Desulfosporosinus shakirovi TaxID=2885154 RepID=UPI001E32E030|nr:hypothetical protein [Desulfosporosinus sp. SRJS8]MCB8817056.1 hypothetical protein [Desulfosporosinus sp. SRJS8]
MKRKKLLLAAFISCLLVIVFPTPSYADMGPKDEPTVYVENPPNQVYYLDLLTQNSSSYFEYHFLDKNGEELWP